MFVFRTQALQLHNLRIRVALDNMSQGLCMFDADVRLVVCNRRYGNMYKVPDTMARPGTTLVQLLEYRAAQGSFSRNIEDYRAELLASMQGGATRSKEVKSKDGRTILVTNRPMAGGGWVATRSTPPLRPRAPAKPARASRWWPPKSNRWPCKPPKRPRTLRSSGAADGAKLVVSVLSEVGGAATDPRHSAQSVLEASQAVEAAASELRREVEGFLASVTA
jgi:hypothetical protein